MGQEVEHPLIGSIDKQRKARQAFIRQLKLPDDPTGGASRTSSVTREVALGSGSWRERLTLVPLSTSPARPSTARSSSGTGTCSTGRSAGGSAVGAGQDRPDVAVGRRLGAAEATLGWGFLSWTGYWLTGKAASRGRGRRADPVPALVLRGRPRRRLPLPHGAASAAQGLGQGPDGWVSRPARCTRRSCSTTGRATARSVVTSRTRGRRSSRCPRPDQEHDEAVPGADPEETREALRHPDRQAERLVGRRPPADRGGHELGARDRGWPAEADHPRGDPELGRLGNGGHEMVGRSRATPRRPRSAPRPASSTSSTPTAPAATRWPSGRGLGLRRGRGRDRPDGTACCGTRSRRPPNAPLTAKDAPGGGPSRSRVTRPGSTLARTAGS
jgi:hypothetical protein